MQDPVCLCCATSKASHFPWDVSVGGGGGGSDGIKMSVEQSRFLSRRQKDTSGTKTGRGAFDLVLSARVIRLEWLLKVLSMSASTCPQTSLMG